MNNKIIKTIDEHNIDRDASVMFAFDLDGSEYVSYRIGRDEEQDNLFVSKVLKNLDGTYNMVDVDDSSEKSKLNSIVMSLVESAVKNPADKLAGNSLSLSDGRTVKFISVGFNKEQKIKVRKTYVTTVKKEVSRVAEKYYDVVEVVEQPKVIEDIFPTVAPVTQVVPEEVKPVVMPTPVVETPIVETPVLVSPVVEVPKVESQSVTAVPSVNAPVEVSPVEPAPSVVDPITNVPASPASVIMPTPEKVESIQETPVIAPTPVVATPTAVVPEPVAVTTAPQSLIFDASKETNLNAALGEVASAETIPVENIAPVREFGVDTPAQPVVNPQPAVAPMVQPEVVSEPLKLTKKAGFANSKFFMLVAVAFFLASCIFLGYEVFNYFQLTK